MPVIRWLLVSRCHHSRHTSSAGSQPLGTLLHARQACGQVQGDPAALLHMLHDQLLTAASALLLRVGSGRCGQRSSQAQARQRQHRRSLRPCIRLLLLLRLQHPTRLATPGLQLSTSQPKCDGLLQMGRWVAGR